MKRCTRCDQDKPADADHFPVMRRYGKEELNAWCRDCHKAYNRENYLLHKQGIGMQRY